MSTEHSFIPLYMTIYLTKQLIFFVGHLCCFQIFTYKINKIYFTYKYFTYKIK